MSNSLFVIVAGDARAQVDLIQNKTEIVYWYNPYRASALRATTALIKEFEQANPTIRVRAETISHDITSDSRLRIALASGNAPDIYKMDRFLIAQAVEEHQLEDISPHTLEESKIDFHSHITPALEEVKIDNKYYALPTDFDARMLFYRKDILKSSGIDTDFFDLDNPPLSISKLKIIATSLDQRQSNGQYQRIGFIPWLDEGWPYTWGIVFGAQLVDSKKCRLSLDTPQVAAAFNLVTNWFQIKDRKKVADFLEKNYPPNSAATKHPFVTGKVPMVIGGTWMIEDLRQLLPPDKWGLTWVPSNVNRKTSWSGGFGLVIPKGSKHKAEALKFMKFAAGPSGQRIMLRLARELPTQKSLYDAQWDFSTNVDKIVRTILKSSNTRPYLPFWSKLWSFLSLAQKNAISGEGNLKDDIGRAIPPFHGDQGTRCSKIKFEPPQ